MASSSSEVIDTTKPTFDLSLRKSTANRLDYLYEIFHVPEDSKIPITDFPIVNPCTVFDKPFCNPCKRGFPWLVYIRENSKEVALVLFKVIMEGFNNSFGSGFKGQGLDLVFYF